MDKWTALEPVKLYGSGGASASNAAAKGPKAPPNPNLYARYIGPLPVDIHVLIVQFLPVNVLPAYALGSRATARLLHDERIWKRKCEILRLQEPTVSALVAGIEDPTSTPGAGKERAPPVLDVQVEEDEFGDFASAPLATTLSANGFNETPRSASFTPITASGFTESTSDPAKAILRTLYIQAHLILRGLARRLVGTAPHLLLTALFPPPHTPPLRQQAQTLALLMRFLSPPIQPVPNWPELRSLLASAIDRFQAGVLAAFEAADSQDDETGMTEAAWSSWQVWGDEEHSSVNGLFKNEWELGRVWAEKLEIFYEGSRWDPSLNFTKDDGLGFEAMDDFMNHVVETLKKYGSQAVRVFPRESRVLLAFADRLANEVIGEYVTPLLSRARGLKNPELFLQATAASFVQSWRLVSALLEVGHVPSTPLTTSKSGIPSSQSDPNRRASMSLSPPTLQADASEAPIRAAAMTHTQAEDVVFRMFEPNMDEYLEEEIEHLKQALEAICTDWDVKASTQSSDTAPDAESRATAQLLTSSNPAQVKRTVLASFTDLMLLPVTIVPRSINAVGAIVQTGGSAAVSGIAMLNPGRWIGASGAGSAGTDKSREGYENAKDMKGAVVEKDTVVFKTVDEDGEDEDDMTMIEYPGGDGSSISTRQADRRAISSSSASIANSTTSSAHRGTGSIASVPPSFDSLQLLLSLDTALSLIHADREALKRVETFSGYPGHYGHRVHDTIEEVFVLMVQVMGSNHIVPGFSKATDQMKAYNPTDAGDSERVAPLMQFFELVHIGDMIQSMVQVYFDKEVARHIDRTDFLNAVVREKKLFENALDDSVAAGLNAGTEVLMNQVEHIIQTRTGPREYYPLEGATMDLQPTIGCREAIACLRTHCDLLKGSTTKEVLEVFHQEIGIRLHAIIQKHLKRQIISLEGGFQVIADLNAYHAFISTLRVPLIAADFASLKMLGHVYIVEDAKDLAQIVRDVTRYGASFRPEDVYEFIQRRSDWKKIEKTVDKAMYNLSFKEDCIIA